MLKVRQLMGAKERIETIQKWGQSLEKMDWTKYFDHVLSSNPWFTSSNLQLAVEGILKYLDPANLQKWLSSYDLKNVHVKKIGLVMAGNIPMVGFHDLLCVLISGHQAIVKLSGQDEILLPLICQDLFQINSAFKGLVVFSNQIHCQDIDALIATGSDNTARYLRYHYTGIPQVIRKNRTSHGIFQGSETIQDFQEIGHDIFSYFGRGCRNISKIWVPLQYDFTPFINSNRKYLSLLEHPKYRQNYRYRKALFQLQKKRFLDAGYLLICRDHATVSPLSVLYYDHYHDLPALQRQIADQQEKLQCIVSANGWFPQSIDFGGSQKPDLWDYADGLDTMEFLISL